MNNTVTKALIYCRVSSLKQVAEGHGLKSQEPRCRTYAASKGYDVVEVFHDDGVSGGLFDRPDMQRLIQYLDSHLYEQFAIIFDDLARLELGYWAFPAPPGLKMVKDPVHGKVLF